MSRIVGVLDALPDIHISTFWTCSMSRLEIYIYLVLILPKPTNNTYILYVTFKSKAFHYQTMLPHHGPEFSKIVQS